VTINIAAAEKVLPDHIFILFKLIESPCNRNCDRIFIQAS